MAILSFDGRVQIAIKIVTESYPDARLYEADGTALGDSTTSGILLPGQSEIVTLQIPAPLMPTDYFARVDGTSDTGIVVECDESNNQDGTAQAGCSIVQ